MLTSAGNGLNGARQIFALRFRSNAELVGERTPVVYSSSIKIGHPA